MHVFRHVNQIGNSYVFLSRKRMDILLTSASETCNLRIPPERISTAETFENYTNQLSTEYEQLSSQTSSL
jgi:hypothetical protein